MNKFIGLGALISVGMTAQVSAAPCLTNPAAPAGNPAFGATVQTFINLGVNPTVTCLEDALWANPAGFALGSYVKGAEGLGGTPDPTVLTYNGATVDGTFAGNANNLDFYWVQDTSANANINGIVGSGPSGGMVWDLGGPANQAVVFPFVDHGPVPGEVLENSVWLSNDPNAADGGWTLASLDHVYLQGWSADPNIADGFVPVYRLADPTATFRYVSVTWGGPDAIVRDGDNEIDAVGGLTAQGCGVNSTGPDCQPAPVAEPESLGLLALGLLGVRLSRRKI